MSGLQRIKVPKQTKSAEKIFLLSKPVLKLDITLLDGDIFLKRRSLKGAATCGDEDFEKWERTKGNNSNTVYILIEAAAPINAPAQR